jgi:hypothetical protein
MNTLSKLSAITLEGFDPSTQIGKIQARKKPWTPFEIRPIEPNPITLNNGTYRALQKCIALALNLELPVGELTLSGSSIVENFNQALLSNAKDEATHFKAFEEAQKAYNIPYQYLGKASEYAKLMLSLDEHPVAVAGFIELTVFFPSLAIMRKWGNTDLKRMVQDVSRDESTHVATNYLIWDTMGLSFNNFQAINEARKEIICWLTKDLRNVKEDQNYWLNQSEQLMNARVAPELSWTSVGIFQASFEMAKAY